MFIIQPDRFQFGDNGPVYSACWQVNEQCGAYRGFFVRNHADGIGLAATLAAQYGACSLLIDREA